MGSSHGRRIGSYALAALALLMAAVPARGDGMRGRWRIALEAGGMDYRQEVRSESANVLTLVDASGQVVDRFTDPRSDEAIAGRLEIRPPFVGTLTAQYGLTRTMLLDLSVGYQRADVSDIEIHRLNSTNNSFFRRISAGSLDRIPIRLGVTRRFRPDHRLNPLLGVGLGYSFVGLDTGAELDALSVALDASEGTMALLRPDSLAPGGTNWTIIGSPPSGPFDGVDVVADDAYESYLSAGIEYAVARHWALTFDLRLIESSGSVRLRFNGQKELGRTVPQGTVRTGDPISEATYGPLAVLVGGLIDVTGDGVNDPGFYYVRGGDLEYDGLAASIGVRYTF